MSNATLETSKALGISAKDLGEMDFMDFCGWVFLAGGDVEFRDVKTGRVLYIADGYRTLWEAA